MQRSCDFCGMSYLARSRSSRFCSSTCRLRNHRSPVRAVSALPVHASPPGGLVAAITAEFEQSGLLGTVLAQQALVLARRVESPLESGSGVASASKELRTVVAALRACRVEDDPLDELRRRREWKVAAGGRSRASTGP